MLLDGQNLTRQAAMAEDHWCPQLLSQGKEQPCCPDGEILQVQGLLLTQSHQCELEEARGGHSCAGGDQALVSNKGQAFEKYRH